MPAILSSVAIFCEGGAVADREPAEQRRNVLFYRLLGEAHPVADLFVLETLGHELQHRRLPIGQTSALDPAPLVI